MIHPSIDFLQKFRPDGPWVLTVIPTEGGKTTTATFDGKSLDRLESWLARFRDTHNIYFSVNPTRVRMEKKANREDILEVSYLHVDADPRVGEDLQDEQSRIALLFQTFNPRPTFTVFSGGGFQGFWKLETPIPINGQLEAAEDAKRYNQQLEILLGGDCCHDISRIMRLPGSINHPNEKKRKKGRKEVMAEVADFDLSRVYPLSQFLQAPLIQSAEGQADASAPQVDTSNVPRLQSMDQLPPSVQPYVKMVIVQGKDPDNTTKWPSRSECLFFVVCELVRANVPDDMIYSIITDPDWKISESVLDKGSSMVERYALHQIQRAHDKAVCPELEELNRKHVAIANYGGKCRVLTEEKDVAFDRPRIVAQTFSDIRDFYCNRYVTAKVPKKNKDGNITVVDEQVPLGKWWLTHAKRRQFQSVVFMPGHSYPDMYNLWRGFTCDAKPGDCSLLLEHIRETLCGGDENIYQYLMGWLANLVQHPDRPGEVAVVLKGSQGTGKSFFVKAVGKLFGRHFLAVSDPKHLIGSFNAHLRDCVLLFGDEAFYAGDKKNESILKMLITEPHLMVEPKGVDAELCPNYVHLIMASNSNWVVPVAMDDRRFFVLNVNDRHKLDTEFFGACDKQLKNGGYEALLYLLLSWDLSKWNLQDVPGTEAKTEQKVLSLEPEMEWWFDKLQDGRIFSNHERWVDQVIQTELRADLINFLKTAPSYRHVSMQRVTRLLAKVMPPGYPRIRQLVRNVGEIDTTGEALCLKPRAFVIPTLEECRGKWEELNGPTDWQEIEETRDREVY
jgi:hypothetical protein